MYTAKILSNDVDKRDQRRAVVVEFTNGKDTFIVTYHMSSNGTYDELKKRVADVIAEREAVETTEFPLGDIDLTGVNPGPTPEDVERQEYLNAQNHYRLLKEMEDDGTLPQSEVTKMNQLKSIVQSQYQRKFFGIPE